MLDKIYIYETRKLDYLQSYIDKARSLQFDVIMLDKGNIQQDNRFKQFLDLYEHYSCNSPEFEINCFARYFSIAAAHQQQGTFILSDSDIYITNNLPALRDEPAIRNVFVGSEGFFENGSELQISPHFSIWDKDLINDFVDYLLEVYRRNKQQPFLAALYESQKTLLGRTAISDMTLLYMWIQERKIPFLNSNKADSTLGIDHNISALVTEGGSFAAFSGRKALDVSRSGVTCKTRAGNRQSMSVLHFQGGYKQILNDFYLGNTFKFYLFSLYINYGRKVKSMMSKSS